MGTCYGHSQVGTSGINGDMFFISPDNTTLLLSDGASGAGKSGKVVMSNHCAQTIQAHPFSTSGLTPREYLDKMIWKINNDLIDISQKSKVYTFGTLVICVVHQHRATIASVGDSPAYLISQQGIQRVAQTHKTYQNLVDFGLLTAAQAEENVQKLHPYMHSMFDVFLPMVVPVYAVEAVDIAAGDMIVLCCDGVSDHVKPKEIMEMLNRDNLHSGMETIFSTAKARAIADKNAHQYDDITMVVYVSE